MVTETDSHGRLYLPSKLRERYGDRFHIVEYEDRLELIPVDPDPLEGLREAVGGAFEGKSVEELRREGREQAVADALDDVRRD
jgi:bifunctional DNA-binding transcriptional regulator/antitoxin component of YhaV-PrlF toxin-antitoxin module